MHMTIPPFIGVPNHPDCEHTQSQASVPPPDETYAGSPTVLDGPKKFCVAIVVHA